MKKIFLLFVIVLSLFESRAQLFHEDFELTDSVISYSSGASGWQSNSRISAGGLLCDSASIQNPGDTTILSTIVFDCSTSSQVFLTFNHICKIELFDQALVEYSIDSGLTFSPLTGPYNAASYPEWLPAVPNKIPDNSWWKFELLDATSQLSGYSQVAIRFILFDGNNNGGNGHAGWYIDNLIVLSTAPPDLGVTGLVNFDISAIANSNMTVDIAIKNFGPDTLYSFVSGYSLNGSNPVTQPWTGILPPNDEVTVSSLPAITIPSGLFDLCAFVNVPGDINQNNDTLCLTYNGLPLLSVPYANDFEGPNVGWLEPNTLSYPTLWELGLPNYGVTNSTHSGLKCWDTNLDTNYFGPCNTILYSPYFDFSTIGNAQVSFWQNYKTEPFSDGLRLDYNINGTGWQTLGLANNPLTNNWYTDSLLNSTQNPAWEGNSNGWIQSTYPLPSVFSNQAAIQFRFVFSADNSVNSDGVSIDDFSILLSPCGNTINYSTIPTTCGDSIQFNYTASAPIANIFWDLGNGTSSIQGTSNAFYVSGNYLVTLYTLDSNGCEASSVIPITTTTGFSVNAGLDVLSCGAASQLNVLASPPGIYLYSWSPVVGLTNPLVSNPMANHVDSLTYTITVTDNNSGCITSDEIIVTVYSGFNDTVTLCKGGAALLDLGPGANAYLWQTYTDTLGNIIPINITSQAYYATQPGFYNANAIFPICGSINSVFEIRIDTNCITDVWPGDCNYDQLADNNDLLNIGVAYGTTATVRPGATNNWVAQPSPEWAGYFSSGVNFKHSDCNGDGLIDSLDVPVILQNYGLNHPLKSNPVLEQQNLPIPAIYLTADVDTAGISDLINVSVNLGTSLVPVDSIYAIAFSIQYETNYIDTNSCSGNFGGSWLGTPGTDMLSLEKHFSSFGYSDFALARTNQVNILNGNGTLAVMSIVTTDNLSGKGILHFNLFDVRAITISEQVIALTTLGDSVYLDPNFTNIPEVENENEITIYPNPVLNDLTIISKYTKILRVELKNALGQVVTRKEGGSSTTLRLNVSNQAQGIFFLSVLTDKGVISKKVQVNK